MLNKTTKPEADNDKNKSTKKIDHLALAKKYRLQPLQGEFNDVDINKFKNEGRKLY
tara:strand:- start:956 stop:1123 length:168 start_codon:yes stop_codon:yes gene_type:complete